MFNSNHKKSELKKLEEAYEDLELKINEIGVCCITLAKIRNQSSINIISNIEKHLNSSTNFNRVLANTLGDFKGHFSVFTSEIYKTAIYEKFDNNAETLLRAPIDLTPSHTLDTQTGYALLNH